MGIPPTLSMSFLAVIKTEPPSLLNLAASYQHAKTAQILIPAIGAKSHKAVTLEEVFTDVPGVINARTQTRQRKRTIPVPPKPHAPIAPNFLTFVTGANTIMHATPWAVDSDVPSE